jgi:hypothetical protein
MSSTSEPVHLNNHHRNTLRQIFQHPVGHNIEWHAVVSLLQAIGSVVQHRDDMVAVTVGSETEFFDVPAHKDIDTQMVVDLRRMLSVTGYGPVAEEVEAKGREDLRRRPRAGGAPPMGPSCHEGVRV